MEITLCTFQLAIDALGPLLFATRSASSLAQEALFKHSLAMLSALCHVGIRDQTWPSVFHAATLQFQCALRKSDVF